MLCLQKEKKSLLPFEFLELLSHSVQHKQQLHKWIVKKSSFINLSKFHTFGKL